MMQTIRTRLSLNTLLVLILGMSLAAALVWQAVSALYVNTQRDNLLAQAKLIAAALQEQPLPENPQPYSQAMNVTPGIHMRLLTEGGAVVFNLPLDFVSVQAPLADPTASIPTSELIQRPEIKSALEGTPASALRRVFDGQRVLYAAAPIQNDRGEITGLVYIATPLPASGLPTEIILELAGAIFLAILLAFLAGRYLSRQIATPLEHLSSAANSIARGDLQTRVITDSKVAELNHLGQTFNHMAESLHKSDETKKAFIADVTHELRTPLTVIKGTIETLEDGALDDKEGRGPLLASMQHETDRLIRMVNELLVLTRADAGSLPLEIRSLDLAVLANERCELLANLARQKGVALEVRKADWNSDLQARADPDRLAQVLDNLLGNAIRYSPLNSTVTVFIEEKDDGVECSVTDQGMGIPAQYLPYIFERFYRVDKSRTRKDGGTGLGLAIAQALVNAMGGRISAQSTEDKGTTITVWLPKP